MAQSNRLIYITGAPASGKTTLIQGLGLRIGACKIIEYGQLVKRRLEERGQSASHSDLRANSSRLVRSTDIAKLDEEIADDVRGWLKESHVLIGSHAVNHEDYGVRVTPFSATALSNLPFNAILILDVLPEELVRRRGKTTGRLWSTAEQANQLQTLQIQLGIMYGVLAGCPVCVFDANRSPVELLETVISALARERLFEL